MVRNPPNQSTTETIAQYYLHYLDYLELRAYVEEIRSDLNKSSELDKFIAGTSHSDAIFRISRKERNSKDPHVMQKFGQGAVVTTLTHYLEELNLPNGHASSSASRYVASDSDSDDSAPSQFSRLRGSPRTKSLSRSTPTLSKKKKKKSPPTRRVMGLEIDFNDPCASIIVPDGLEPHETMRLNMYQAGLRQVTRSPTKFADGMKCAVCGKPHPFDKCPILNDIPLLKKHFIAYCLQMNRTQKLMTEKIHKMDATWGVVDDDDDNDDVNDDDDNNDQDFQEEEE